MFCEWGCALVADVAGDTTWLLVQALLLSTCVGCSETRELGAVLTRCFTVSFVCRHKRRVGAVLGIERRWTGAACCCLFALGVWSLYGRTFFLADAMCV